MISLIVPTLHRYDLLEKLIISAESGSVRPDRYVIIDNGGKLRESATKLPANSDVFNPGRNIGVAAAWNHGLRTCDDWIIISNDDVELGPHTIKNLVRAAEEGAGGFLYPSCTPGGFCLFLLTKSVIKTIGYFDEGFWPAYYEDIDFHRRMRLAKVKEAAVLDADYTHVGSASFKTMNNEQRAEHHRTFSANARRYVLKWGGPPGAETSEKPITSTPLPHALPAQQQPRTNRRVKMREERPGMWVAPGRPRLTWGQRLERRRR